MPRLRSRPSVVWIWSPRAKAAMATARVSAEASAKANATPAESDEAVGLHEIRFTRNSPFHAACSHRDW